MCMPCVWDVESLNPRPAKPYTALKTVATASTSKQIDVLYWHYNALQTHYKLWCNMANMKDLVLAYLKLNLILAKQA